MAKRYTETEKWSDPWFRDLSDDLKLFWGYLLDNCDRAGVWTVDWPIARFRMPSLREADKILPAMGDRVVVLSEFEWWIPKFVYIQYGTFTGPMNKAQVGAAQVVDQRRLSEKYDMWLKDYQTLHGLSIECRSNADATAEGKGNGKGNGNGTFLNISKERVFGILSVWNSMVAEANKTPGVELSEIKSVSSKRQKHLGARLEDPNFDIDKICNEILHSDLLRGLVKSETHKHWKVDFDWIIVNDSNFVKIIEGKYRNKGRVVPAKHIPLHER